MLLLAVFVLRNGEDEFFLFVVAVLYGTLLAIGSVLMGLWTEGRVADGRNSVSLFRYTGLWPAVVLVTFAAFSLLGYRQLQLYYLGKGFVGFLKGRQTWGKFRRGRF